MTQAVAATPAGWRDVAEKGSLVAMRLLVRWATMFGRGPARFVLRFVALYYVLVHGSVRRSSRDALTRITGRDATFGMVYRHVLTFAEASLDRLFFLSGRGEKLSVTGNGYPLFLEVMEKKRGAILLGAHLGSFEAMRAKGARHGLPVNVVGYFRNARMVNATLREISPGLLARVIDIGQPQVEFMMQIKRALERGELVAILGDRVSEGERAVAVDFFGAKTRFPTGPYAIAAAMKCPILLTFGLYHRPDHYELYCEAFADEIVLPRADREAALRGYAQRFAERLEHHVRLAPDNWFNFYDFWAQ